MRKATFKAPTPLCITSKGVFQSYFSGVFSAKVGKTRYPTPLPTRERELVVLLNRLNISLYNSLLISCIIRDQWRMEQPLLPNG